MKKTDLLKEYEELIEAGKEIEEIVLYIHMPTGETETINNPNVEAKINYLKNAYDDNLVLKTNENIYIEDVIFVKDEELEEFPFYVVLMMLKLDNAKGHGRKFARRNWNGPNQYIYCVPEGKYDAITDPAKEIADEDGKVNYRPYLALKTVDGSIATWVPSISDLLADDWYIVK